MSQIERQVLPPTHQSQPASARKTPAGLRACPRPGRPPPGWTAAAADAPCGSSSETAAAAAAPSAAATATAGWLAANAGSGANCRQAARGCAARRRAGVSPASLVRPRRASRWAGASRAGPPGRARRARRAMRVGRVRRPRQRMRRTAKQAPLVRGRRYCTCRGKARAARPGPAAAFAHAARPSAARRQSARPLQAGSAPAPAAAGGRCPWPESLRVFRSCPLITPKDAQSSLQMLAIARYGCPLRLDRTPVERAARSHPKNSQALSWPRAGCG